MGSIETAFGSEGYMKTKNVHVGHLIVHDTLDVDDMATFQDDVQVQGTVIAKNGVKIGDTMFTEDKLNKYTTGFSGVMDTWEEPSNKKFKPDSSGRLDSGIPDDPASDKNILMADTILTKNQIVTRTGLLVGYTGKEKEKANKTTPGSEVDDSFILPDRMSSENMYVDNIHERTKDKGVNVQNTLYVGTVGTKASGGAITIDADVKLKDGKSMGSTTLTSVVTGAPITTGPLPGDGDLIVQGNATFKKAVTFEDKYQLVDIPNLKVGDLTVTGKSTGTGNSSDTISTNEIKVKTDNNSISVTAPINAVDYVYKNETGVKCGADGKFYKPYDMMDDMLSIDKLKEYFTAYTIENGNKVIDNTKTGSLWTELGTLIGTKTYQSGGNTPASVIEPDWELLQFVCWNHFNYVPMNTANYNYKSFIERYGSLAIDQFLKSANDYTLDSCFTRLYINYVIKSGTTTTTIGMEILNKCRADKVFLQKLLDFLDIAWNAGKVNGKYYFCLDTTSKIYNAVTQVVIDPNTCEMEIYRGSDKKNIDENRDIDIIYNGVAVESNNFYIKQLMWGFVFECLLVNMFMERYHGTICENSILKKPIIAKTAHNKKFIPSWANTINNFTNLAEYEKWWNDTTLDQYDKSKMWLRIIWDQTSKYINESNGIFSYSIEDIMNDIMWPSYLEWKETNPADDFKVDIEYRRGPTGSSMVVLKKTKDANDKVTAVDVIAKFSTSSMLYPQMEVNRIDGDVTMESSLSVPNMTVSNVSGPDDKAVRIPIIEADQIFLNGSKMQADPNGIDSKLSFNTKRCFVYKEKCDGTHTDAGYVSVDNGSGTQRFSIPEVYLDINYTGELFFIRVRPFSIYGKELLKEFRQLSDSDNGWGRIKLPLGTTGESLNPYSFPTLDRTRTLDKKMLCPGVVMDYNYIDTDGQTVKEKKAVPNYNNLYCVGSTSIVWVKHLKDKDELDRYDVFNTGTIRFYLTSCCCRCLSFEWEFDSDYEFTTEVYRLNSKGVSELTRVANWKIYDSEYKVPTDCTYVNDFVYAEGFSFSALKCDEADKANKKYGFYDKDKAYA